MAGAGIAAEKEVPRTRLRRQWRRGVRSFFDFIRGDGGLESGFEMMLALAGPTVQREFDRFAASEVGRRLLAESPRRDLNELLADRAALAAMPKGSFADAYLDYMGDAGMGTSNDFLHAAGLERKAAEYGWSSDQLWFVRRMANSHDLFHVVSGYDRSILGEVGVNAYTAGQMPMLPLQLFVLYLLTLKPSAPLEWSRFLARSYRHGRDTPPLSCVEYEAMLELPMEEARRRMGVAPLEEVHPNGFPGCGRTLEKLERKINVK